MGAWLAGTPSLVVDGELWQKLMPGVQPPWQGWTHPSLSRPSARGAGAIPHGLEFRGSGDDQWMGIGRDC